MPREGYPYQCRRFFLLVIFLTGILLPKGIAQNGFSAPANARWLTDFETASAEAAASGRPILISFSGSDWCLPCMRLNKDLFATPAFMDWSSAHVVLLKVDFPSRKKNKLPAAQVKHNKALAERYNQRGSFPLVVVVDASGNVLGHMAHPLATTSAYIESLQRFVQP